MGFRGTLNLGQFNKRFIANSLLGIGVIDRFACPVDHHEHSAIGAVGVVRYGQGFNALRANGVHPVPKAFGVLAVETRKRHHGQFIRIAENDVAMQVAALIGGRCVLVCSKGCELAGLVVSVGGGNGVRPCIFRDVVENPLVGFTAGNAI